MTAADPPGWCIAARLGPGGGPRRAAALEPHLAYLRAHRAEIRIAGPILADDGVTAIGSLTLIDLPSRADAERWIAREPYNLHGAFDRTPVVRWRSDLAQRQHDFARTEGWQQFLVTAFDAPGAQARRAAAADAERAHAARWRRHCIARGPFVTDDGARAIGTLLLMEFPDRAAFDACWADEPLHAARVYATATIERWRYGKGIG